MDKRTQCGKILDYIDAHGIITVRDAFIKLNINSPTKRFSELFATGKIAKGWHMENGKRKYMYYYIPAEEEPTEPYWNDDDPCDYLPIEV